MIGVSLVLVVMYSLPGIISENNSVSGYLSMNMSQTVSSSSSILCDSMSVNYDYFALVDNPSTLHFFLLIDPPALTDHDSFHVYEDFLPYSYTSSSHRYLYPGSSYNMSACKESTDSVVEFCLIKGENNYDMWVNNHEPSFAEHCDDIMSVCSNTTDVRTSYNYYVESPAEYYYAFYQIDDSTSSVVQADFYVYRTKFAADPDNVIESCSASAKTDGDCTLYPPLGRSIIGLLSLSTTVDFPGLDATLFFSLDCNPRILVYVLISFVIASLTIFLMSCACLVACCFHGNKRTYARLRVREEELPTHDQHNTPPHHSTLYGSTGSSNNS